MNKDAPNSHSTQMSHETCLKRTQPNYIRKIKGKTTVFKVELNEMMSRQQWNNRNLNRRHISNKSINVTQFCVCLSDVGGDYFLLYHI